MIEINNQYFIGIRFEIWSINDNLEGRETFIYYKN